MNPEAGCSAGLTGYPDFNAVEVIPIPGSSRPSTIEDSVAAADLRLTDDEVERLSAA